MSTQALSDHSTVEVGHVYREMYRGQEGDLWEIAHVEENGDVLARVPGTKRGYAVPFPAAFVSEWERVEISNPTTELEQDARYRTRDQWGDRPPGTEFVVTARLIDFLAYSSEDRCAGYEVRFADGSTGTLKHSIRLELLDAP